MSLDKIENDILNLLKNKKEISYIYLQDKLDHPNNEIANACANLDKKEEIYLENGLIKKN